MHGVSQFAVFGGLRSIAVGRSPLQRRAFLHDRLSVVLNVAEISSALKVDLVVPERQDACRDAALAHAEILVY